MAFSFSTTLGWLELVPALLPIIKQAILTVESPGGGPAKFQAVIETVQLALTTLLPANSTAEEIAAILEFVKPLINLYVALFNKQGEMPVPPVGPAAESKEQLIERIAKIRVRIAKLEAKELKTEEDKQQIINKTATLREAEDKLAKL